jgi:hypothetical protein
MSRLSHYKIEKQAWECNQGIYAKCPVILPDLICVKPLILLSRFTC